MFKKLVLALTLATSLFVATPKAHAGLGIGFIFGAPGAGAAIGAGAGAAYIIGQVIIMDNDLSTAILMLVAFPLYTVGGALLDVDSALSTSELYVAFQKKYPFIDNHEALANLSGMVKEKFLKVAQANPTAKDAYITLSHEEVASALETADITGAQFEQIANDLK